MSKNKKMSKKEFENLLPQNIVSIGESAAQALKVYFLQKVYNEIHKFTKGKTTGESGGILVGKVISEFGKTNILVNGFIEAKYCESNSATLTFTHKTWEYVHKELDKRYKDQKIVGWIHTHPDFGIFLSEYDEFVHKNFFKEEFQIAYVIDNIRKEQGIFFVKNDKLEKMPGFYIYDKPGAKISSRKIDRVSLKKKRNFQNIFIFIEFIIIFILIGAVASLKLEIMFLENALDSIVEQANQNFYDIYQTLNNKGEMGE